MTGEQNKNPDIQDKLKRACDIVERGKYQNRSIPLDRALIASLSEINGYDALFNEKDTGLFIDPSDTNNTLFDSPDIKKSR